MYNTEFTMMKRLLLITLLPALVLAQEKRALTIDEALQLGLQNSRLLHISEAKAMAADAKSSEANAARLPSLKLQAGYTRLSDVQPFAVTLPSSPTPIVISPTVLDQYTSKVSLQQPLFTGFRLEKSAAAADYSAQASHYDFERDRLDMVYNVRIAYWSVYKATEVKRVVDENIEQTKAHVTDVKNMMAQGLVTKNEVLKVEVQLSNALLAQIESANNVKNATMSLNSLIGLPLETDVQIASLTKAQAEQTQSADALAQQALVSRADVKSAEMRVNAADASVSAAKGGWFPQLSLFSNVYYSRPNPRVLPAKDELKDTWDVGVSLSWDIWNWGTTEHQSDQAEAVHTQTRYALEQLKDNVSLEVNQSYLSLAQSKEKVGVATMGMEQAEENYRMTKDKFTNGSATNTELLDAEIALLQSKLNYTVSLVDYELANAKLARALGREN
jgi:outer membrane protein TolC